jgi:hypothetical protein
MISGVGHFSARSNKHDRDVILPPSNGDAINYMTSTLLSDYNTFLVAASVVSNQGNINYYCRLSAQVYLEMEDVKWLEVMVPKLLNEYST